MVPLLKHNIENIVEALPGNESLYKVLDIGCGGQPFRLLFEAKGHEYVSADAQDPLGIVDYIMELDNEIPPGLGTRAPFDFILCTEVLEHVADWDQAFSNLARLLKVGGKVLITCPQVYVLHEQPYDFWRPTIYALRFYSKKHNLQELRLEKLGDSWDVLGTLLGANYDKLRPSGPGLANRFSASLSNFALKMIYKGLKQRWFQRRYSLSNDRFPIYLSNLALLQKVSILPT